MIVSYYNEFMPNICVMSCNQFLFTLVCVLYYIPKTPRWASSNKPICINFSIRISNFLYKWKITKDTKVDVLHFSSATEKFDTISFSLFEANFDKLEKGKFIKIKHHRLILLLKLSSLILNTNEWKQNICKWVRIRM